MANNTNGTSIDKRINGEKLNNVDSFKYLGTVVTDQGPSLKYCPELHI